MSDSSRHQLDAVAEVTYGTTPASPVLKTIRHTATTLALTKGSMISEELRSDRQVADFRHGARQVGGDISGELSYGTFDDFLEAVLLGTWAAKNSAYTAGTISAAAADNSLNDSASGFPALDPGDKITVSGFTGASTTANATMVVVTRTASKIVVSGVTLINDAAGESVTITTVTNRLKAGTTRRSFSVLRSYTDQLSGDKPYHLFKGVELNTMSLTVGVESIVGVKFGAIGQDLAVSATEPSGATHTAVNTNAVVDSFNGSLKEGGSTLAVVTEVSMTLENGIVPRFVVGTDLTARPAIGRSNLTGQLTAYFENSTLLEKFINQTASSLDFTLTDAAGQKLRFYIPNIKYTGTQTDTQGHGPITYVLPFQAIRDTTLSTSQIAIDRIP